MGDNVFINICFSILVIIIILALIIRVLILKKKIKNINRLQKEINILGDDISLLKKNKETYKYILNETISINQIIGIIIILFGIGLFLKEHN